MAEAAGRIQRLVENMKFYSFLYFVGMIVTSWLLLSLNATVSLNFTPFVALSVFSLHPWAVLFCKSLKEGSH